MYNIMLNKKKEWKMFYVFFKYFTVPGNLVFCGNAEEEEVFFNFMMISAISRWVIVKL